MNSTLYCFSTGCIYLFDVDGILYVHGTAYNVGPHHGDAVLVGIFLVFPQLALNGFFSLVV